MARQRGADTTEPGSVYYSRGSRVLKEVEDAEMRALFPKDWSLNLGRLLGRLA